MTWIYRSFMGTARAYLGCTILLTMRWESEFTGNGPKWLWCSKTVKRDDNVTENRDGESLCWAREVLQGWCVLTGQAPGRSHPLSYREYRGSVRSIKESVLGASLGWNIDWVSRGEMRRCQIHWFSQIGGRQLLHSVILIHRKMQLAVLTS